MTCNFIKKETLALVFSCEFCEISKNSFFTEHLRTTASVFCDFLWVYQIIQYWHTWSLPNLKSSTCIAKQPEILNHTQWLNPGVIWYFEQVVFFHILKYFASHIYYSLLNFSCATLESYIYLLLMLDATSYFWCKPNWFGQRQNYLNCKVNYIYEAIDTVV